jgi:hypothetical protein
VGDRGRGPRRAHVAGGRRVRGLTPGSLGGGGGGPPPPPDSVACAPVLTSADKPVPLPSFLFLYKHVPLYSNPILLAYFQSFPIDTYLLK